MGIFRVDIYVCEIIFLSDILREDDPELDANFGSNTLLENMPNFAWFESY